MGWGQWIGRTALVLFALAALVACESGGKLYVSQPLVHTRERLVKERVEESQWLHDQLEETKNIKTRYQGIRDFRRFSGIYNELQAGYDPSLGVLNRQRLATLETAEKADYWEQKLAEYQARQAYLDARKKSKAPTDDSSGDASASGGDSGDAGDADAAGDGGSGNAGDTAAAADGGDSAEPADLDRGSLPSANAPFGRAYSEQPGYPDPSGVEETKAAPGLLDLFHDRRTYRSAVRAAIRETQLDDAHDVAGSMLYELTMNLTFVPGDDTRRLVQVTLELQEEPEEERQVQLAHLFESWRRSLRPTMVREIAELYRAYSTGNMSSAQREWLEAFLWTGIYEVTEAVESDWLPRIQAREHPFFSTPLQGWKETRGAVEIESDLTQALKKVRGLAYEVQGTDTREILDQPRGGPADDRLLAAIALGVWLKYTRDLDRVVSITPPSVSDSPTAPHLVGLQVLDAAAAGPGEQGKTGVDLFVERLLNAEKSMYALALKPKEHAQNISDVAAREKVQNLIFALSAVLPTAGLTAKNSTQFLDKSKELLHTITRKPLLVGFGMGGHRFGWVVGPKFTIDKGTAGWRHEAIRHDVSASIVVPAWRNLIQLSGSYQWVDAEGDPGAAQPLWTERKNGEVERDSLYLRLTMPNDAMKLVTRALVAHAMGTGDPLFEITTRPLPTVRFPRSPRKGDTARNKNLLVAEAEKQQVLVIGENLWRNPEVFVGSQKANRVEVLADMAGLLATFDKPRYPGEVPVKDRKGVPVDLVVVTTYGSTRVENAVRILPPREKKTAAPKAPPATLATTLVVGNNQKVVWSYPEPKSFGKVEMKASFADGSGSAGKASNPEWDVKKKRLGFDLATRAATVKILETTLTEYPKAYTDEGKKQVGKGNLTFFPAAKNAAFRLANAVVTFDLAGAPDKKVSLFLEKAHLEAFEVAYPGLTKAIKDKAVRVILLGSSSEILETLPAVPSQGGTRRWLEVDKTVLGNRKDALVAHTAPGPRAIALSFPGTREKSVRIPVVLNTPAAPAAGIRFVATKAPTPAPPPMASLVAVTITIDNGAIQGTPRIALTLPKDKRKEIESAYPGFGKALAAPAGAFTVLLRSSLDQPLRVTPIPLAVDAANLVFKADVSTLASQVKEFTAIEANDRTGIRATLRVVVPGPGNTVHRIPTGKGETVTLVVK